MGTPNRVTTTIVDSSAVAVTVADITVDEGDAAVFTVSLSGTASTVSVPVTVSYATVEGSAREDDDYRRAAGDAVVAAGQTAATFTVETVDNDVAEVHETFTVTLSAVNLPDGVTLDTAVATATIMDDDALVATVVGPERVDEGDAAQFTVTLSQPLFEAVTVSYATAGRRSHGAR